MFLCNTKTDEMSLLLSLAFCKFYS